MTSPRQAAHPMPGAIGYLQLPAGDVALSASFYRSVFGWTVDTDSGGFEAPGIIGQFTTDLAPGGSGGPVPWITAADLWPTLERVKTAGGTVMSRPQRDGDERWLVEIADPAGTRVGIVAPARQAMSQPMLVVDDVEIASRWYQEVLGFRSDQGGPDYERLTADGILVLQLHQALVEHEHGRLGRPGAAGGNTIIWFGEVSDFDGVVERADRLQATVLKPPHRNPSSGEGNGPSHREIWLADLDGHTVVVASPDGEAFEN